MYVYGLVKSCMLEECMWWRWKKVLLVVGVIIGILLICWFCMRFYLVWFYSCFCREKKIGKKLYSSDVRENWWGLYVIFGLMEGEKLGW